MTVSPGPSDQSSPPAPTGFIGRIAFIVGSVGLLAAMSADALAVLGRHIGLPLLGSIEIVQASVVLLASAAMVGTTLSNKHARAHLLVDRLSTRGRRWLLAGSDAISAAVFFWFAAGSLWIALELWHGHEHSELLHIPWSWLRFIWITSSLLIGMVFLIRAIRRADIPS
jgi:TRAP-type transport system small permease protein